MSRLSAAHLLALDNTSRRQETVRFDLLDATNAKIGTLDIAREQPPSITNDVNRRIIRTLDNIEISASDLSQINTVTERVRPWWILGDGGTGYEFSLGIFLWGDASRTPRSYGTGQHGSLVDQCLILDQPLPQSVSYPAGTNIATALTEQAGLGGIISLSIDATTRTVSAPATWAAGRDTRLKVMQDLCAMAGFLQPYFDNNGVLICRAAPNLATAIPDFSYGRGTGTTGRVIDATVVASNDLLTAPNRYEVIDTSATTSPLVGLFDVPASAPHSFANRGFYVVSVIELQGLADQASADAAAAAAYAQDSSTFSWLAFHATPDPRHDTFNVIAFDSVNYREQSWRLPLSAGADHEHDCRGIYV